MTVLGIPKTLAWWNFGAAKEKVPDDYLGSHVDCHIEVNIGASFGATSDKINGGHKLTNVLVNVTLVAGRTWVMKGVPKFPNQAAILQHEQGHFDIAAITAKDLDAALIALRNDDPKTLLAEASQLVASISSSGQTEEETYDGPVADGGTDHGSDVTQQATWTSKLAAAKTLGDLP